MQVKLGELTRIRTDKLETNASSSDGKYPFSLVLRSRCELIHTHMTVNMFWLLENSFLSNVKIYLQRKTENIKLPTCLFASFCPILQFWTFFMDSKYKEK